MTDREAIEITELQVKALQEEMKTLTTQEDIDAYTVAIEAKQLAIFALQEREERSKGCEYCEIVVWRTHYDREGNEIEYNFCPMCGHPLKGAQND